MATILISGDFVNPHTNQFNIDNKLSNIIKSVDYAIINLEGAEYYDNNYNGIKQVTGTISKLSNLGFKMLLLANNHIADRGKDALQYTIQEINKNNLDYIGAGLSYDEASKITIKNIKGVKIGFVNVCEAQEYGCFHTRKKEFGYYWLMDPSLEKRIHTLKKIVNKVIVLPHAGLEHYSIPLPAFRILYKRFCDAGADAVIASHPHVPQGLEYYNDSLIIYSLGNFFFQDPLWNEKQNQSYSVILNIEVDAKITFDIVYHELVKDTIYYRDSHEINFNIEELSSLLELPQYEIEVKKMIDESYNTLLVNLYKSSINGVTPNDNIIRKLKNICKYLLNRSFSGLNKTQRENLLLHIVENETYRFLLYEKLDK